MVLLFTLPIPGLPRHFFQRIPVRSEQMLDVVFRPTTQGGCIHPGVVGAVVHCRVRMCMAQGGWQEDNPTAMAQCTWRCWDSFGRRGCLKSGGIQRTTQQGRCGSSARSPTCQDVLLLAESAHEASLERTWQRRWPAPWEEGRAAGCDDSRPHTSRKCRERNQVEGANKAGAPGGRRSTARDLPSG